MCFFFFKFIDYIVFHKVGMIASPSFKPDNIKWEKETKVTVCFFFFNIG